MKKLILFELRKVFSKRLALITLIGIILFSALLSFSTFQNKYAFDQNIGKGTGKTAVEIDKEIAAKYEGILTDKKVQQMMSDFAPTSDLHGLSAIYVYQNAMQSAAFSRFSDKEGNWNGLSVSDVFGNEEIKIGYVDGWLSTSRNMVRVFVALALAVIIMLAPIFFGEYEGVDIMQDKATNPGKTSRPEKNPLDAKTPYHIGNRSFVVEPVFKEESPDTLGSVLLRLMKSESEKL